MVSKELITVYKCDRCGKQMDSQYAILTLKHAGITLSNDDLINKDLCVDCFDKISKLVNDKKAMIVSTEGFTVKDFYKDVPMEIPTTSPLERGTYVT